MLSRPGPSWWPGKKRSDGPRRPQLAVSAFFGPLVRGRRRPLGGPAVDPPLGGGGAPPDDERGVCRALHVGPGGARPQLHVRHTYRLARGRMGGRRRDHDPNSRAGYHAYAACRALQRALSQCSDRSRHPPRPGADYDWTDVRERDHTDARGKPRLARVPDHAGHRSAGPAHVMEPAVAARGRCAGGHGRPCLSTESHSEQTVLKESSRSSAKENRFPSPTVPISWWALSDSELRCK